MSNLAVINNGALTTDPDAERIRELYDSHKRAIGRLLEDAIEIGKILIRKKEELGARKFSPWLRENCEFGDRRAYDFRQLAENSKLILQAHAVEPLSIKQALKLLNEFEEPEEELEVIEAELMVAAPIAPAPAPQKLKPGQAVTIADPTSAYAGKKATVERFDGELAIAKIGGVKLPFFPADLQAVEPTPQPEKPKQATAAELKTLLQDCYTEIGGYLSAGLRSRVERALGL